MATVFKGKERRFEENPGRIDRFRLMTDVSIGGNKPPYRNLDFDVRKLNPGEYSSLYHSHRNAEELFMIISGSAALRTPRGVERVEAGDVIFMEAGETGAHQMFNDTSGPCVYLDVRTFDNIDVVDYPDSGRVLIVPSMERFGKGDQTGLFEGEGSVDEIWAKLKNRQDK